MALHKEGNRHINLVIYLASSLRLYQCLFISLSFSLSLYIYIYIYISVCFINLATILSTFKFICLNLLISLSSKLTTFISVFLSLFISIDLFICLLVSLSYFLFNLFRKSAPVLGRHKCRHMRHCQPFWSPLIEAMNPIWCPVRASFTHKGCKNDNCSR